MDNAASVIYPPLNFTSTDQPVHKKINQRMLIGNSFGSVQPTVGPVQLSSPV
jgi:hypothetical protein